MADAAPVETKNLDRYRYAELPLSRPHDLLAGGSLGAEVTHFLGTAGTEIVQAGFPARLRDLRVPGPLVKYRSPSSHTAPIPEACGLPSGLEGIDLVFEGVSQRITDTPTLDRAVAIYRESGWPAEVDGDVFTAPYSAPSTGPPPWYLYRLTFYTVFAVATAEPYGATRWRFGR